VSASQGERRVDGIARRPVREERPIVNVAATTGGRRMPAAAASLVIP
jgi:hypothetical protein